MGSVAGALCGGGGWGGQGVCLLMRPGAGLNDDLCFSGSEPSCCSACALRAYCARSGRDTHPRIPVTCLVARRSSKAHMRTTKLPSTWNCPYEQTTQPCKVELCRGMQDAHMFKWQVPHSDSAFDCDQAKTGESVTPTQGPTPKYGSPWWRSAKKKCEKGWKWVKVGENPKMPYPQCGRSIKTYTRGNNDAPSITMYGSPVRLDAQILALRPHCMCNALNAPPMYLYGCTGRSPGWSPVGSSGTGGGISL